ncbi:hypothetical protein [Antribacter gilvus]|uniref:hypothetical protein n=1 Tax=Antribacter gilvus TaxID=2304675 RepID=UPI000F780ABA|nr:hypothetical protein [Antribacter gilvus]
MPVVDGIWLGGDEAAGALGERHWWPLVTVDPVVSGAAGDELVAAGGYRLDRDPPDRDRVVRAAADALVAGLDSPALRALAGLYSDADPVEIDDVVREVAAELDLPEPGREAAVWTEAGIVSRAVIEGRQEPWTLTAWAHQRIGHDGGPGLLALVRLDDEYAMIEEVPGYYEVPDRQERLRALDDVVRAAATVIVAGETDLTRFVPVRWRA